MLSNEDKNEIIEMLRCPECGGNKYIISEEICSEDPLHNYSYNAICPSCNGTGWRLPEKVEEPTINQSDDNIANIEIYKPEKVEEKSCNFIRTGKGCHDCVNQIPAHLNDGNYCGIDMAQECPENMFSHYEEKSCGNCRFYTEETGCKNSNPCYKPILKHWQPKEQSEDLTEIKLSKEDFQQIQESIENPQYNEKLAEALKRPLICEKQDIYDVEDVESYHYDAIKKAADGWKLIEQSEVDYKSLLSEKDKKIEDLKIQATSLSAQFERAEMFRVENEAKDKEIAELEAERDKYKKALTRIDKTSIYGSTGSMTRFCCCESFKNIAKEALGEG